MKASQKIKKFLLRLCIPSVLAMSLFSATACNTIQGVGRDIERGGEVIQDAASR